MTTVKANSQNEEFHWAMIDLRHCREAYAQAALAEEAAEARVEKARKEVNKQKVCIDCGQTPKLAMDAHLVGCVRRSSDQRTEGR